MAQTKKKRRRKHRGTQGGRIDTKRRRPRTREEARSRARASRSSGSSKSAPRSDHPPTWRSSINRGIVAAVIFAAVLLLIFRRPLGAAIGLGAFMLLIYIPAGYYIDMYTWRRRERARIRAREDR
jgi:hypothetical protein